MTQEEIILLCGAVLVIVGLIVKRTKTTKDDAIFAKIKAAFDKFTGSKK